MKVLTVRGLDPDTIAALKESAEAHKARSLEAYLRDVLRRAAAEPVQSWRCFHCGDVFTNVEHARAHFGIDEFQEPGCVAVLRHGESHLLARLVDLQRELMRYQGEDTDIDRWRAGILTDHATAMRREEEKGYERGLRDARSEAAAAATAATLEGNRDTF